VRIEAPDYLPGIGIHDLVTVVQANSCKELGFFDIVESAGGAEEVIASFASLVLKKNEPLHATRLSKR
jgi:hypothetical protein